MDRGVVTVARKVGQRVVIGDGESRIVIEIVKPRGDCMKMRIDAPRSVSIDRAETLEDRGPDAVA